MIGLRRKMLPFALLKRFRRWAMLIGQVDGDYVRAHGRRAALFRPRRFTEKMQWRKLFELDPLFTILSDKLAVRDYVAARIGARYLIPLLWSGSDPHAIPFNRLAPPYVLKSNHAAGQTLIVQDAADIAPEAMGHAAAAWLSHCHGTAMCEPGYIHVPRRLMVETMLFARGDTPPVEYKLFVFGGRVRVILSLVVAPDRIARQAAFYGPDWSPLKWSMTNVPSQSTPTSPPERLSEMIDVAERLAKDLSHLRVDVYDTAAGIRVGELTLYTWSGHEPYQPADVDSILGDFWPLRLPMARALWTITTRQHPVRPRDAETGRPGTKKAVLF